MKYAWGALVCIGAVVAGCGGGNVASNLVKTPEMPTDKESKCNVAKSPMEPLIVEWPATARARLESLTKDRIVAVAYHGCELELLPHCEMTKSGRDKLAMEKNAGPYRFTQVTRKQSRLSIKNEDDLFAKLPISALHLEGKLRTAGQLDVQMTLVGRWQARTTTLDKDSDFVGESCDRATHTISALNVGAFTFSAGGDAEVSGTASGFGAGGGARSTAKKEVLQSDGEESACAKSANGDAPPAECGALIQIEVAPLAASLAPAPPKYAKREALPEPDPIVPPTPEREKCKEGERWMNGRCVKRRDSYEPTPAPTSTSTPDPTPTPDPSTQPKNTAFADKPAAGPLHVGLAVGMIGGSVVFAGAGIASLVFYKKADPEGSPPSKECDKSTLMCTPDGLAARDNAKTWAWVSTVGLGIGVLSGILFWAIPLPKSAQQPSVGFTPLPGGGAFSASGRF
jgi:hypothetical protein